MSNEGPYTTHLTSSKWVVVEMISKIFSAPLPSFPEGDNVPFPRQWRQSNLERIRLWEFLQAKIKIQHRVVERVIVRWGKVVKDPSDVGITRRTAECDVALRIKHDVPYPGTVEHFLQIRFAVDLLADCGDWHVRKVTFIPMKGQADSLYQGAPLEYEIVC